MNSPPMISKGHCVRIAALANLTLKHIVLIDSPRQLMTFHYMMDPPSVVSEGLFIWIAAWANVTLKLIGSDVLLSSL